ncbi:MAG: hypothetical protein ACYDHY_07550 [Acidiferrobacterales bacterium]
MAGFLDKNTRIIDMILTGRGTQLLSQGQLKFVSWAAFDDEIDYNPIIANSSSLTPDALQATVLEHVELTPIREATKGYQGGLNISGTDNTNVHRPLFSMPQGSTYLPRVAGQSGTFTINVQQQKIQQLLIKRDQNANVIERMGPYDQGHVRFNTSTLKFTFILPSTDYPQDYHPEGYFIKVFCSGAEGLNQIFENVDSNNNLSYQNDLILDIS